jgi:short-subunit dehydrogenase
MQEFNVSVTLLAPGFVLTPLTEKNPHKMPFMINQKQAGQEIVNAIYKKKKIHIFPKPFKFVATLLNDLPRPMYRFLMEKKVFDPKGH